MKGLKNEANKMQCAKRLHNQSERALYDQFLYKKDIYIYIKSELAKFDDFICWFFSSGYPCVSWTLTETEQSVPQPPFCYFGGKDFVCSTSRNRAALRLALKLK